MDEGTPEELQKLMQRQGEKLSLAEINQLKGECCFMGLESNNFHLSRTHGWVDVHYMWQELETASVLGVSVRCVHVHSFRAAVNVDVAWGIA